MQQYLIKLRIIIIIILTQDKVQVNGLKYNIINILKAYNTNISIELNITTAADIKLGHIQIRQIAFNLHNRRLF